MIWHSLDMTVSFQTFNFYYTSLLWCLGYCKVVVVLSKFCFNGKNFSLLLCESDNSLWKSTTLVEIGQRLSIHYKQLVKYVPHIACLLLARPKYHCQSLIQQQTVPKGDSLVFYDTGLLTLDHHVRYLCRYTILIDYHFH